MKHRIAYDRTMRNLNVGCGTHFHASWCNIDLVSTSPDVLQYDIRQGLPFDDGSFDCVYHSHVLEHLNPEQGEFLIRECGRVLSPGGTLRVVVPDLEQIVKLYLKMLQTAWDGDTSALDNYQWMKLELLDQLVRHQSGGQMGPYMISRDKSNADFVRSRIGSELESCQSQGKSAPLKSRFSCWFDALRGRLARRAVGILLGSESRAALDEGLFRQQGEIHRWMYDRLSLKMLCEKCGLTGFHVCQANESAIAGFAAFQLDSREDQVRKPDSLFIECRKPAMALRSAA